MIDERKRRRRRKKKIQEGRRGEKAKQRKKTKRYTRRYVIEEATMKNTTQRGPSISQKPWKQIYTTRTSTNAGAITKTSIPNTNYSERKTQQMDKVSVREQYTLLKQAKEEEKQRKILETKERQERKLANERKNEVTQVITDKRKIKNMSRKARRNLTTRAAKDNT